MGSSETASTTQQTLISRAVLRDIEPGSLADCVYCSERLKFQAKVRPKQVICNVYEDGRWNRVEYYHVHCYEEAARPHGPVDTKPIVRSRKAAKPASQVAT